MIRFVQPNIRQDCDDLFVNFSLYFVPCLRYGIERIRYPAILSLFLTPLGFDSRLFAKFFGVLLARSLFFLLHALEFPVFPFANQSSVSSRSRSNLRFSSRFFVATTSSAEAIKPFDGGPKRFFGAFGDPFPATFAGAFSVCGIGGTPSSSKRRTWLSGIRQCWPSVNSASIEPASHSFRMWWAETPNNFATAPVRK
jgi:hypothetical protein